jgi:hypothetical protein
MFLHGGNMRFVIYDDESLEPITVLDLPFTNSWMDERIRQHGYRCRLAVPEPLTFRQKPDADLQTAKMRVVEIEFEPFVRNSRRHSKQRAWFCFTRAAELAMLLNPAWLPGQVGAVRYLEDQNDALTKMLMRVF